MHSYFITAVLSSFTKKLNSMTLLLLYSPVMNLYRFFSLFGMLGGSPTTLVTVQSSLTWHRMLPNSTNDLCRIQNLNLMKGALIHWAMAVPGSFRH